jgi:MoxR-like ATPase
MTTPLNEKFQTLKTEVGKELLERSEPIETGVLALISKKHHFQLGPPGVAKSALIERLVSRIGGIPSGGYFHYQLDKFTKPEELFGPPDMTELLDNSRMVQKIDWALPSAYFAFIDEIFKGNSSILNAMLLAMNERKYNTDEGPKKLPLISIFSASNELPESNELLAMYDRLHIRHYVQPLQGGDSFAEMMLSEWDDDPEPIVTLADIQEAHLESKKVIVGANILDALYDLRISLRSENLEPSDRRWRNSLDVIRAAAWLEGEGSVDIRHARVLAHMLWDDDSNRRKIQNLCHDITDPLEGELQGFYDDLHEWQKDWRQQVSATESEDERQGLATELWTKTRKVKNRIQAIEELSAAEGRTMPTATALLGSIETFIKEILKEGFDLELHDLLAAKGK